MHLYIVDALRSKALSYYTYGDDFYRFGFPYIALIDHTALVLFYVPVTVAVAS